MHDLRIAVRTLRRTPAFTGSALLSLSLTLGASTALFTLLNALDLRDAPVRAPEQLVQVSTGTPAAPNAGLSRSMFQELSRDQEVFSGVIGWYGTRVSTVDLNGQIARVGQWFVTGDFYAELGVRPVAGRFLTADDDRPISGGFAPGAVLGYSFWQRAGGGDMGILGHTIRVDGVPVTVVGIAPKGFTGVGLTVEPDVTVPLTMLRAFEDSPGDLDRVMITTVGRLKAGVSLDQARARLTVLWPAMKSATVPATSTGAQREAFLALPLVVTSAARGADRLFRSKAARALYLLLGIALVMVLIAGLNLSGLMLARVAGQRRDMGVRVALGARPWQLAQTVILESALLSLAGAGGGLIVGLWASEAIKRFMLQGSQVSYPLDVRPDARVVGAAVMTALLVAVLVSAAAIAWLTRRHSAALLQQHRHGVRGLGRLGPLLVATQVALCFVLLTSAGLLMRSLQALRATGDLHYRRDGVTLVELYPRPHGYEGLDNDTYQPALLARIAAVPGVRAASFSFVIPGIGAPRMEPAAPLGATTEASAAVASVSPGFFRVLHIPLIEGRDFAWTDNSRHPRVAILSQRLRQQFFGDGAAIGRHIQLERDGTRQDLEVIGVVADAELYDRRQAPPFAAYTAHLQDGDVASWKVVLLESDSISAGQLRDAVDPLGHEYVGAIRTLMQDTDANLFVERMTAILAGFFSGLTVLLAGVGVYGLMAYVTTQRQQEIGIRLALGAAPQRILTGVASQGAGIAVIGVLPGVALALLAGRVMRSALFGITPHDASTFILTAALMVLVVLAGCIVPAIRAARINPAISLRTE